MIRPGKASGLEDWKLVIHLDSSAGSVVLEQSSSTMVFVMAHIKELEFELIPSQMAQKPVLRVKWVCACNAHGVRRKKGRYWTSAEVQGA